MIYSPIWKDIEFKSSASTLDYLIRDDDSEVVHSGYTNRMPDQTGITINVNTRVEELLGPDFDLDIRDADNDVIPNGRAFRAFSLGTGSTELESYGFLYDWSYEENWTGQTAYCMTKPINGHLDPRMKTKYTVYNTGETTFNWQIEYDTFVEVFPSSLHYSHTGGSESVNVSTNDCWEITTIPEWITASITADCGSYSALSFTEIVFTAEAHNGDVRRTGEIVLTFSEGTAVISVVQEAYVSINVVPTSLSYVFTGETKQVSVTSNGSWWIASKPDWISSPTPTGYKNATVNLTASVNPSSARSGVVVFQTNSESVSVNVTQEAWTDSITITPSVYVFPSSGGTKTFTVSSNVAWVITNTPDWLTFNGAMSGNSGSYNIIASTVAPNNTFVEKSGTIVATGGTATASANVGQARLAMTLTVYPPSLSWVNTGGTSSLTITSNYGWQMSGNTMDWATFSATSGGSGTTVINVTASFNPTSTPKSSSITFYNSDNSVQVPLYVEESDPSQFWIVCTYDIPSAGTYPVLGNVSTGNTGMKTFKSSMRVDGIDVPLAKNYNFTTPGRHIIKYQVSGETGYIGYQMYAGNQYLVECEIAQNVTSGGLNCFSGCTNLSAVTFAQPSIFRSTGMNFCDGTSISSFVCPSSMEYIAGNSFIGCTQLETMVLNDGLNEISNNAFKNTIIKELVIPDSVTTLLEWACTDMHQLTAVTIGSGITSLEYGTFMECTSLREITIPSGITYMEDAIFYGDSLLTSINVEATTAPATTMYTFSHIAPYGTLTYPAGSDYSSWLSTSRYYLGYYGWNQERSQLTYRTTDSNVISTLSSGDTAFGKDIVSNVYENGQGTITFIGSPTVIDDGTHSFWGQSTLLAIDSMPDTVTAVTDNAFHECTSLTGVTFGSGVEVLGNAFGGCTGFTNVVLPQSLKVIGDGAFSYNNARPTSITIPDGVTTIGDNVFYQCTSLTGSVVIPDSVTYVGNNFISQCSGVTSLTIGAGVTSFGAGYSNTNLDSLTTFVLKPTTSPFPNNYGMFRLPALTTVYCYFTDNFTQQMLLLSNGTASNVTCHCKPGMTQSLTNLFCYYHGANNNPQTWTFIEDL